MQRKESLCNLVSLIPFAEVTPTASSSYVPFTASFAGKKAVDILDPINSKLLKTLNSRLGALYV